MTRVSPPELARALPGPHASTSVTRAPRRCSSSAVQPPKAPAPTTTTRIDTPCDTPSMPAADAIIGSRIDALSTSRRLAPIAARSLLLRRDPGPRGLVGGDELRDVPLQRLVRRGARVHHMPPFVVRERHAIGERLVVAEVPEVDLGPHEHARHVVVAGDDVHLQIRIA